MKLSYTEGPKFLHVSRNDVVFWADGVEYTFRSLTHAELLVLLINRHPNTVSSENIFDHFRAVSPIGSKSRLDQTIHKIVHGARQDLSSAGLKMPVIRNVRGVGYRVAEGWTVEAETNSVGLVESEMQELQGLVHRCVEYVSTRRVVTNQAGLLYLDAERHVAQENFLLLDRIGWQLLHSLGERELVPDILDIKNDLSVLMSYIVFWRVGHRLTEDEWKEDYRQEIQKVLGDVQMRIQKIKNFYAAPKLLPSAV